MMRTPNYDCGLNVIVARYFVQVEKYFSFDPIFQFSKFIKLPETNHTDEVKNNS